RRAHPPARPHRTRRRRPRTRTGCTKPPIGNARRVPRPPNPQGDSMKFRSDPRQITGSIAPVMSPFHANGEPDLKSLANLINWQIASGAHGISIGGPTGEPSAQSMQERAAAIRVAAEVIGDRVPFVPGTGASKRAEARELTSIARDAGADAALIITPYYARP